MQESLEVLQGCQLLGSTFLASIAVLNYDHFNGLLCDQGQRDLEGVWSAGPVFNLTFSFVHLHGHSNLFRLIHGHTLYDMYEY